MVRKKAGETGRSRDLGSVPGAGGGVPSIVNDVEGPNVFRVEWAVGRDRHALHTRQRREPCLHTIRELVLRRVEIVLLAAQRDIEHHEVLRPEAGIHVGQALKAADQEPGPHQQHGAKRELREYENGSGALASRGAASPSARAEDGRDIPAGRMECGDEAEDETCGDGKRRRKCEHACIDPHILRPRESEHPPCRQHMHDEHGEHRAEHCPAHGNEHTLGE